MLDLLFQLRAPYKISSSVSSSLDFCPLSNPSPFILCVFFTCNGPFRETILSLEAIASSIFPAKAWVRIEFPLVGSDAPQVLMVVVMLSGVLTTFYSSSRFRGPAIAWFLFGGFW